MSRVPSPHLTPLMQRFVAEYVVDLNATQAAIRAGYSAGQQNASASVQGSKLLALPKIQRAIARQHRTRLSRVGLRAEDVIRELRAIAFSDIRQIVDDQGEPLPLRSLPDEVASAVSSVSVDSDGRGGTRTRVRTWDKTVALRLLVERLLPALPQAHVVLTPEQLASLSDPDLDKVQRANEMLLEVTSGLTQKETRARV